MRAIGIVLAGGNSSRMKELSNKRAVAAMPIAGGYRSIDFVLSNMSNSHIQKVAVFTQYNAKSLNEHLNSSKWWDFGRKQGGLYVFTPTTTPENSYWYRGTADAMAQNLDFLKSSHEPYVVIASGDGVYKMDYAKVLEYHIAKKADITIVTSTVDERDDPSRFGVINTESTKVRFAEASKLLDYGFSKFSFKNFGNKNDVIQNVNVSKGIKNTVNAILEDNAGTLIEKGKENQITQNITINDNIQAPLKKGDKIGEVTFTLDGQTLATTNLVAENNIDKITPFTTCKQIIYSWIDLLRS